MQLDPLGLGLVGADVGPRDSQAPDQSPLHGADHLVMLAVIGELQVKDRGHPPDFGEQSGGFFLRGGLKFTSGWSGTVGHVETWGGSYCVRCSLVDEFVFGEVDGRKVVARSDAVALF